MTGKGDTRHAVFSPEKMAYYLSVKENKDNADGSDNPGNIDLQGCCRALMDYLTRDQPDVRFADHANIIWCAAKNGHLDCVKVALENGAAWDEEICVLAAGGGHMNVLEYARDNGRAWDRRDTLLAATENGHSFCYRFLREYRKDWTRKPSQTARRGVKRALTDSSCAKKQHR